MSKALTTRTPNSKTLSPCGKFMTYTSYKPKKLKNGDIVYHKHTESRKLICVNVAEKNKVLTQIKKKISHNPDISLAHIENFLKIVNNNPEKIIKVIAPSIKSH